MSSGQRGARDGGSHSPRDVYPGGNQSQDGTYAVVWGHWADLQGRKRTLCPVGAESCGRLELQVGTVTAWSPPGLGRVDEHGIHPQTSHPDHNEMTCRRGWGCATKRNLLVPAADGRVGPREDLLWVGREGDSLPDRGAWNVSSRWAERS